MPGVSQSTGGPDNFSVLAVCDSNGKFDSQAPKPITVHTSMTSADLDRVCQDAFGLGFVCGINVRWKEGGRTELIETRNCSQILQRLKGRVGDGSGGDDMLPITSISGDYYGS